MFLYLSLGKLIIKFCSSGVDKLKFTSHGMYFEHLDDDDVHKRVGEHDLCNSIKDENGVSTVGTYYKKVQIVGGTGWSKTFPCI